MSFNLPSGWVFQSASNNGNTVTYALPGHTTEKPKLCVISRTIPVYNPKSGWSIPSYRVRVIHGIVDVDGKPVETRTSADVTFRHSMASGGAAEGDAVVTEFASVISADGFAAAVFAGQQFPKPTV